MKVSAGGTPVGYELFPNLFSFGTSGCTGLDGRVQARHETSDCDDPDGQRAYVLAVCACGRAEGSPRGWCGRSVGRAPTETDFTGQLKIVDTMINRHVDAIAVAPI